MDAIVNADQLSWKRVVDTSNAKEHIDYSGALLGSRPDGTIDILYRWEPNAFCHFHRHLCATTSLVISGELNVITYEDNEVINSRVRRPGDYAHNEGPDVHREFAGPEGAIVLFHLKTDDGRLVEQLNEDGSVARVLTQEQVERNWQ
jgi:hypothetical protein